MLSATITIKRKTTKSVLPPCYNDKVKNPPTGALTRGVVSPDTGGRVRIWVRVKLDARGLTRATVSPNTGSVNMYWS